VCIAKIKPRFPYSLKLFGSFVGICVLRVRWGGGKRKVRVRVGRG